MILLLVTTDPKAAMPVCRAKRVSGIVGAECFAVAVQRSGESGSMPEADREASCLICAKCHAIVFD